MSKKHRVVVMDDGEKQQKMLFSEFIKIPFVFGRTGSGMSTTLRNSLLQDILGHGGRVVVIEPHSDLIDEQTEGVRHA